MNFEFTQVERLWASPRTERQPYHDCHVGYVKGMYIQCAIWASFRPVGGERL